MKSTNNKICDVKRKLASILLWGENEQTSRGHADRV